MNTRRQNQIAVLIGRCLQLVGAQLDRIVNVLEAAPEQDLGALCSAPHLTGQIELKHVSFCDDPHAPLVLRDISVAIAPGQKRRWSGGRDRARAHSPGCCSASIPQLYRQHLPDGSVVVR